MPVYSGFRFMKRFKLPSRHLRSQRGSFLLSSLAVVLLLSMMILFNWKTIAESKRDLDRATLASSRDLVVIAALRQSRVATYYYYAILENDPVNDMFIKCVIDDDLGDDCVVAPGGYPMKLVDYNPTTSAYTLVSGTQTNPAYYDHYGQVCPAVSADCPFEISTMFQPRCTGAAATCAAAATFEVSVNVNVNPTYNSDLIQLAGTASKQVVAISDYQNHYYPVLPPTTIHGTPITFGPGVDGYITKQMYGPPVVSPTPTPVPTPPPSGPPSVTTCAAGEVKGATCGTFQF